VKVITCPWNALKAICPNIRAIKKNSLEIRSSMTTNKWKLGHSFLGPRNVECGSLAVLNVAAPDLWRGPM